ncbi:nischarin-like isoform X1 [Dermacentor variabilis]|uniref:nischarin-like isoform X1 n=1 Tax=Dermacentor variabilis TaxID=34621 RepID=UPI003F5C403F
MALYQPVQSWMKASEAVKIIGTEQGDGFTVYRVQVTIPPYCWVAKHRYSDFKELHNKASMVLPDVSVQRCSSVQLRRNYHVERSLLPPGKVLGRQAASFVQQRQAELEHYLVTLVHHFADGLPLPLARFLHFDQFEVRTVVADLAEQLFETGEQTLAGDSRFCTTPLQLHCLTERLKLAEPTCSSEDKRRDLAHVLDFVSQLRHLDVVAEPGCLGASSVRPSCLPFDLSPFRSLRTLRLQGCEVRGQLSGLEVLRPHLRELAVESALSPMADLSCILVAGDIWQAAAWPQVQRACFNRNGLHTIDLSVRLLTSVEHLELLGNKLSKVENLECLSRLSTLNMAENSLRQLPPLHTRLGNVRQLILAGNQIDSLAGLSRLYSLVELDVSHNAIALVSEVGHVGALPCLESLDLRANPVNQLIDYRAHALLLFGGRANEVVLDGQKATQKELDTVNVLRALQVAKDRRPPTNTAATGCPSTNLQPCAPEGGAPELSGPLMDKRPDAAADEFRKQVATMRTLGGTDWLRLFNRMSQQQQTTQQLNPVQPAQSLPAAPSGSDCEKPIGELALPDWLLRTGLQQPSFQDQLQAQAKGLAPEWVAWCTRVEAPTVATTVVCIVANCTGLNLLELEQVQGSSGAVVPQFGQCTTIAPSRIERLLRGPHRSYIELRTELQSRASGTLLLPATAEEADDLMRKFAATFGLECRDKFAPAHVECVAAGAMSAADVRYCGRMLSNGADAGMIHYVLVVRKEIVVVVEDTFGVVQPFRVEQTWNVALPVVDVQLPEHWPASVASVDEFRKCGFGVRISFEGGQQFEARFQVRDSRSQFLEAFLAARNS